MESKAFVIEELSPREKRLLNFDTLKMKWKKIERYRVLFQIAIIFFTFGIPYLYGNMTSYSASYFRFSLETNDVNIGSEWMIPIFLSSNSIGTIFTKRLTNIFGLHKSLVLSLLVFDASLCMTYFSIQHSAWLSLVTLMVVPGFCIGITSAVNYFYTDGWFKDGPNLGLALSIITSSGAMGGIFYNKIVTLCINPDNETPNIREGKLVYFSQPDLLDRVPYVFLVIAGVTSVMHICGALFLKDPPPHSIITYNIERDMTTTREEARHNCNNKSPMENHASTIPISIENKQTVAIFKVNCFHSSNEGHDKEGDKDNSDHENELGAGTHEVEIVEEKKGKDQERGDVAEKGNKEISHRNITTNQNGKIYCSNFATSEENQMRNNSFGYNTFEDKSNGVVSENVQIENVEIDQFAKNKGIGDNNANTMNPTEQATTFKSTLKDILRNPNFWPVWFTLFSLTTCFITVVTFYKRFGEVYVKDDQCMMVIGSTAIVGVITIRIISGIVVDKFGFKFTVAGLLFGNSILMVFWSVSIHGGWFVYLIMTTLLQATCSCVFALLPMAISKIFGQADYMVYIGVMKTALLTSCLVSPGLLGYVLESSTWNNVFLVGGCLSSVAFVLVVIFLKEK